MHDKFWITYSSHFKNWLSIAVCLLASMAGMADRAAAGSASSNSNNHLLELPAVSVPTTSLPPLKPSTPAVPVNGTAAMPATPVLPSAPTVPSIPTSIVVPPSAPTTPSVTSIDPAVVISKNPDVILMPLRLSNISLMFPKSESDILKPFVEAYDNAPHLKKTENAALPDNNFLDLLGSLANKDKTQKTITLLPNIYLGSIVYYSPRYWSVWLNGKKLVSKYNAPENEFFISFLSRTQAELVWHPSSFADIYSHWKSRTNDGKNPLRGINVDGAKGNIILRLRPNQRFFPQSLVICEGLRKFCGTSSMMASPNPYSNSNTNSAAAK